MSTSTPIASTGVTLSSPTRTLDVVSGSGVSSTLNVETTPTGDRLTVPAGHQAVLTELFESRGTDAYSVHSNLQIVLQPEATLKHYKVVLEGEQASHQSFVEVQSDRASQFESHVFLLGGLRVRQTIHVRMAGEHVQCTLNGLYLTTGDQVAESYTVIDHLKPHGTSRELYKGILDQRSQAVFDGLIIVEKDAQKTDSTQTNRNLLLSNQAKAKSNPELKINANDVKCKHGATIGQINPESLFYFRSRGIPEAEARKLLIFAFASEMIDRVELLPLRERLTELLYKNFQ